MIDDPLSLLSLGIWLMAAGMWPVGFLFGACSACCDEECDECACYFNEYKDYECRPITCFPNVSQTISIDTATLNNAEENIDTNFWNIGTSPVSILGDRDGEPSEITTIAYQYVMTNTGQPLCSGTECQHFIQFLAYPDGFDGVTYFESPPMLLFTSGECAPLSLDKNFEDIEWTLKFGNDDSIWDNMKAYLETLTPNVLLSYDACPQDCKCNKCTHWHHTGGECYDIPFLTPSPFTWSYTIEGIGTVTVPNVTLEPSTGQGQNSLDIPLEILPPPDEPFSWSTAYIMAGDFERPPETDECGCNKCGYGISLQVRLRIDDDEEKQYLKYFFGTLDECNQNVVEMTPSQQWVSELSYGGDFGDAVLEFLNSLNISMSLSEFETCDCGACCDEGCEDNVAEGGCENWAGVGTFCGCPDFPNPCDE
jgi:hypothetical protein